MWINEDKRQSFDGLLLVVDHHKEKDREAMCDQVSNAHAGGMAVFYIFNDIKDVCLPSDDVEWIEGMDFLRPLQGKSIKKLVDELLEEVNPRYKDVIVFDKGKKKGKKT